ncbi:head-tail joining protein [Rhizosaccharibacter radicis]|uniref:Uncharacterized protein n=1 Tax=Rhizosaccharibacter radicis TaxID=2782605 RepID=A0ABT1VXY3_9PROT|nr:hypothetical protein [Acetobacteraceae bacterium KSS12]
MAIDWGGLVLAPCVAIFGEAATHRSADGQDRAVQGIFDSGFLAVDPLPVYGFTPAHISTYTACLGIRLSDFPVAPEQGDLITVRGVRYWIWDVRPDGKDGAKLMLNEQVLQR